MTLSLYSAWYWKQIRLVSWLIFGCVKLHCFLNQYLASSYMYSQYMVSKAIVLD